MITLTDAHAIDQARYHATRAARLTRIRDYDLILKASILSHSVLAPACLTNAVESVTKHSAWNPSGYLFRCLENEARIYGEDFKALLARVAIPNELEDWPQESDFRPTLPREIVEHLGINIIRF